VCNQCQAETAKADTAASRNEARERDRTVTDLTEKLAAEAATSAALRTEVAAQQASVAAVQGQLSRAQTDLAQAMASVEDGMREMDEQRRAADEEIRALKVAAGGLSGAEQAAAALRERLMQVLIALGPYALSLSLSSDACLLGVSCVCVCAHVRVCVCLQVEGRLASTEAERDALQVLSSTSRAPLSLFSSSAPL